MKIERFRPVALEAGARAAQLSDILAVAMRPLRKTELSAQMTEGQVLQLEELSELAFKDRAADMPKIFECTRELSAIADAGLVHTLTTRLLRRLHLGTLVTEANAEQTYPVDISARQLIHMLGIESRKPRVLTVERLALSPGMRSPARSRELSNQPSPQKKQGSLMDFEEVKVTLAPPEAFVRYVDAAKLKMGM